jgi:hypothetical protein
MGNPPAWVVEGPLDRLGVEGVLSCRFGLAKLVAARSKEVLPYHGTIYWDIFAAPGAIVVRRLPFVGYVTYASVQV